MTIEEVKQLIAGDEHRSLELKKTTGELKDGMLSAFVYLSTNLERWGTGVSRMIERHQIVFRIV